MAAALLIGLLVLLVLTIYGTHLWLGRPQRQRATEWDDSTQIHEWKASVRGDRR